MNNSLVFHVTGASGFVGRHVCSQLISHGYKVKAIIRSADNELEKYGVEIWIGDLWDQNLIRQAITDVDVVIHCAGNAKFGNGLQYNYENIELTNYVLLMTHKYSQNARFIYLSTIGAIDRARPDACKDFIDEKAVAFPTSDYGKSKLEAEELVKNSGLAYSIIRPTMVVGANMRYDSHFAVFARHAISASWVGRLNWPGLFSVVNVDDLANAIILISSDLRALGETYFCAGEAISVGDFMNLCNPQVSRFPLGLFVIFARLFPSWIPFSLKVMLLPALTASDKKLQLLGWKPRHNAFSALEKVIHREKCRLNPTINPGGQTVITGAASGLGKALAEKLSPLRDKLLLVDRDKSALEKIASQLGNAKISVVDLGNISEVEQFLASPNWLESHVNELFACAGIGLRGKIQKISTQDHLKIFNVNVLSRISLSKAAISGMQNRHFGRVVLISSSSAFQALPLMATYAASNSALLSIGEAWGFETAEEGVHVMTVCPGGMQTNFQKSGGVKEVEGEKLMRPELVAEKIIFGLREDRLTLIISFRSFAMSLLARIMPRQWSIKLWGRLMEKMR